jgi:hypothetical protein
MYLAYGDAGPMQMERASLQFGTEHESRNQKVLTLHAAHFLKTDRNTARDLANKPDTTIPGSGLAHVSRLDPKWSFVGRPEEERWGV